MLVFVDLEPFDDGAGRRNEQLLAARTWITYRLEDVSGRHCHLVRHDRIDKALLEAVDAEAIFISGNSIGLDAYPPGDLDALSRVVATSGLPVFGLCGGFQLMANALGAEVVPIEPGSGAETDESIVTTKAGTPFEFGFHPVSIEASPNGAHPLLADLGPNPVFRHAHGLHVPVPPAGFTVVASTPTTPVQLAIDDDRRMVGAQFHPEYWTEEHPAGRTLITNFLRWAGIDRP